MIKGAQDSMAHRETTMRVSFVVPVKGRLDHLKQSLPSMLNQHLVGLDISIEVIVVDYNCPQKTIDWIHSQGHSQVRAVLQSAPLDYFNLSHARNIGCREATGEILAVADADSMLHRNTLGRVLPKMIADPTIVLCQNPYIKGDNKVGRTTSFIRKDAWVKLRGYDESMEGWGWEEADLYRRAELIGKVVGYDIELVQTINHDENRRSTYYEEKNIRASNKKNKKIANNRTRLVNPKGFGLLSPDAVHV